MSLILTMLLIIVGLTGILNPKILLNKNVLSTSDKNIYKQIQKTRLVSIVVFSCGIIVVFCDIMLGLGF